MRNKLFDNKENISFLRRLLSYYDEYGTTRYINVSVLGELESELDSPHIIIWEDSGGRINVTSFDEYNFIMNSLKKQDASIRRKYIPRVLFILDDKKKIFDIMDALISDKNYSEMLASLIHILDDEKKLELK